MKRTALAIVTLILSVLSAVSDCPAEVLYLKSGQQVEGKISEDNNEYVKIVFNGVSLRYGRDEIEKIENNKDIYSDSALDAIDYEKNGTELIAARRFEEAINILQEGHRRKARDAAIYANLGVAYACIGDYQTAASELKTAIDLDNGDCLPILYYNLAEIYCRLNMLNQAQEIMGKITCQNLRNLIERSISLRESGITADTILMASSFPPDTVFFSPQVLGEARNAVSVYLEEANKSEDKAYIIEDFPLLFIYKSPLAYLNLSFSEITEKRFIDAKKHLDAAEATVTDKNEYRQKIALAGVYFARGQIALEECDYYLARKNFKKAIELFNRWNILHKYLATAYYLLKKYPQAQEEFKTALNFLGSDTLEAQEINEYLAKIKNTQS